MNISISGFDNTLFIPSDGGIATLVICNDLFFRRVVEDILDTYTKKEGNNRTVIYDSNHDPLNFAKDILIVTDIFIRSSKSNHHGGPLQKYSRQQRHRRSKISTNRDRYFGYPRRHKYWILAKSELSNRNIYQ